MAIVVSKLISAAMLQDFLIGKDGLPLVAGIVTMYHPSNQPILKNWYYQTGVYGSYTYEALPNPLVLSAAGTIQDVNGNDVIPFYYPYSETDASIPQPYFVTVYDQYGELQFTRSNFPFVAPGNSPSASVLGVDNYIINNRFWRNAGTINAATLPGTWTTQYNSSGTYYYQTIAPDQHEGFSMPDVNYIKNVNGSSTETITFNTFSTTSTPILSGDVGPEYYINHNCTADSSGATLKVYQFPISLHLATLVGQTFSFTIQGQAVTGSPTVNFYIYQFAGTGATSPVPQLIGNFTFTSSWTKFTLTGLTFAGTVPFTLPSTANDDAYYLQIAMPNTSNAVCNLNFTLPSIYLGTQVPTNNFSTYDQIAAIINSPRTGDLRTSINQFYYFGWVPMNDGTIGNASSNATARANSDTWPLYNLIWNLFAAYSTGSSTSGANPIAQMYTSTGTLVGYGPNVTSPTTAINDFNANKAISLTASMGKVMLGTVPMAQLLVNYNQTVTSAQLTNTFTASSGNSGLLLTSSEVLVFGEQVQFTNSGGALPTGLSAATTYYVSPASATTFYVSTSLANATNGVYVAYTNAGTGTNSVTTFAQVFTSSSAMSLYRGCPVIFTNSGGALPASITANTIYYASPSSTTTFCVATSFANAIAGNYVAYTDAGSGTTTVTASFSGESVGEYAHTQLTCEVGSHKHTGTVALNIGALGANSTGFNTSAANSPATALNINNNTPSGTPFNLVQPATYYNIYIKL